MTRKMNQLGRLGGTGGARLDDDDDPSTRGEMAAGTGGGELP